MPSLFTSQQLIAARSRALDTLLDTYYVNAIETCPQNAMEKLLRGMDVIDVASKLLGPPQSNNLTELVSKLPADRVRKPPVTDTKNE